MDENHDEFGQIPELLRLLLAELMRRKQAPENGSAKGATEAEGSAEPEEISGSAEPRSAVADSEAFRRFVRQDWISEVKRNEYKSNAFVYLIGGFSVAEKRLELNGVPTIYLTKPEFVLFLILAAHSRTLKNLWSPRRIEGGKFLTVDEIISAADAWCADEPRLAGFWTNVIYADVHRTVSALRKKIRKSGANPNIIETGPKGGGYRLSTLASNVRILLR